MESGAWEPLSILCQQLRNWTFCLTFLLFPSLLFQSKSWQKAKGMILKSCRVRYRDPLDKASEKQFIVNDDNGTHILGLELNLYVYKTLYIYAPPLPF